MVITLAGSTDQADNLADLYREIAVPSMKADQGFKGAYLLVDRQAGKAVAISLWNSEADMLASEASNRTRQARLKEAGLEAIPFEQRTFEVLGSAAPEAQTNDLYAID